MKQCSPEITAVPVVTRPGQVLRRGPGAGAFEEVEVLELVGRGATAATHRARVSPPLAAAAGGAGREVALKAVGLREAGRRGAWKGLDLLEREARVLRSLSHSRVPAYVDHWSGDLGGDRVFFLAQELFPGENLASLVEAGWRASEPELVKVALDLLEALEYLASLRPPVVHRDCKPENVVVELRGGGKEDSALEARLVDFGGAQEGASQAGWDPESGTALSGSTVVGSYGFMAPEQFRGAACVESDLYGLGATLLFLSSGRAPNEFPLEQGGLGVDFEGRVPLSPRIAAVVKGLLQPLPADRLTAAEARRLLLAPIPGTGRDECRETGGEASRRKRRKKARRVHPKVEVTETPSGGLRVSIEPQGLTADGAMTASFTAAWVGFVAFWTAGALSGGGLLFASFSLPFWVAGGRLMQQTKDELFARQRRETVELGPARVKVRQEPVGLLGRVPGFRDLEALSVREVRGKTYELDCEVATGGQNDDEVLGVALDVSDTAEGEVVIGRGLPEETVRALSRAITEFLEDRGAGPPGRAQSHK